MTLTEREAAELQRGLVSSWWLFLVVGIGWILVSFLVLGSSSSAVATIGYLTAFVLIAAGVNELVLVGFVDSWKWLHVVFGVIVLITGLFALAAPFQTFGILAVLIGWYLLVSGTFNSVLAIAERDELPLWGLQLAAGIAEIVVGLWAIGYIFRSAWLLIIWIGIGALVRGITQIVFAFRLRGARGELA
jgi:uncharacterized membrane protein HdeD (DUF308 family)